MIHDTLIRAMTGQGDRRALVDGEVRLTYGELGQRAHRLAAALQGLGLEHGDHVAVLAHNGFRYMEAYFAASLGGFVLAPINPRLAPAETAFILNDGEARALLLEADFLPALARFRDELFTVRHVILMDGAPVEGLLGYEEIVAAADPARLALRAWKAGDLAHLCYTGGTTGLPKGVMLSQGNVMANVRHAVAMLDLSGEDVWLHVAPMFHLADSWSCCAVTALGAFHVFTPSFDPRRTLELIQRHRVTITSIVPTIVLRMLEAPGQEGLDLSSLRRILYGASPMPVEPLRRAIARFGPILQQGYGQTEAAPFLATMRPEHTRPEGSPEEVRRLASCGLPVEGVEVRVVSRAGEPVTPGEVGEITARGPNVMLGYWKRPEETAAALAGGWLRTGDLATVDAAGFIYIVDRAKDVIISGGENIYSSEVENALYKHPAVAEAAAIGVPDERWGEAVLAVVVPRAGRAVSEAELIAHCRGLIAHYKCPKRVDFREELPKSGAGKILKAELRKPYWAGQARAVH